MLWSGATEGVMRLVAMLSLFVLAFGIPTGTAQAQAVKKHKAASSKPTSKKVTPEQVTAAFQTFCQEWMQKLAVRQRDNIAHIKWNTKPDGVQGEYVGYIQDHTCLVKNEATDPVGEIAYQEVRYEKRGATVAEAEQSPPHAVETTAVTELFHFEKGKWAY
jgi:hypothetical protein